MRADYVNSEAFRLLINSMQWENGLALRVSLETGLRIGDVLALKSSDLRGCKLSYVASKTGKPGAKTVSRKLANAMRNAAGTGYWIFPGRDHRKHRTRQAVYKDLKKVCKRLGVAGQISPHTARKSYAVEEFHEHGLDHVKRELQHDDASVTLLYALSDMLSPAGDSKKDSEAAASESEIVQLLRRVLEIVTDVQQIVHDLENFLL